MRACPIPMEEPATTVPRFIPRQRQPITPVADPTIQVAGVITRRRPVTTHRQRGITSRHRAITISQGSINRRRVITRRGAITELIRVTGGTVITEVAGTMTTGVVDATTNTAGAVITTAKATKMVKATTVKATTAKATTAEADTGNLS